METDGLLSLLRRTSDRLDQQRMELGWEFIGKVVCERKQWESFNTGANFWADWSGIYLFGWR